jgi:hypothetical protein
MTSTPAPGTPGSFSDDLARMTAAQHRPGLVSDIVREVGYGVRHLVAARGVLMLLSRTAR